jgi:hypothetical protein
MNEESEVGLPTRRVMLAAAAGAGVAPVVAPTTLRPDPEVNMPGISSAAATSAACEEGHAPIRVLPNGTIRVEVSSQVMYNLTACQRTMTAVLGRAGCPMCHSGLNIVFALQEAAFQTGG